MPDPGRKSDSMRSRARQLKSALGKKLRRPSLISRERRFYDLFERQAATIVEAADLLELALTEGGNLAERQREIKALENRGDGITHEIVSTLNRTFVTPFDREDIFSLSRSIDDVIDYADSTVSEMVY